MAKFLCCGGASDATSPDEIKAVGKPVTADILAKQDAVTTGAIIDYYGSDATFKKLSERLMKEIVQRDKDDGEKLAKGIQLAVDKGVLPADVQVEPTTKVGGMTPEETAQKIIDKLGDATKTGCIMVLQGLSGVGKGTTVAKLQELLPNATTWSNGNIFRSITLLAVTYSEKENVSLEDALMTQRLQEFMEMLSFDKYNGKWDVKIDGLGLLYYVADVEKTVLKDSKVAKNIPKVAEITQGEVVKFVDQALQKMANDGMNVLVEGREQTLNHIRSPHRFELVLPDMSLIGRRQAALQVGGKAWAALGKSTEKTDEEVSGALDDALKMLASVK